MAGLRGRKFGMVFQEPMTALNPVMRVGRQVEEVLAWHTDMDADARRQRVLELFGQVLLPDPRAMYAAYPFQLSGGQRQRVVIAMALALEPDVLIADEPTTALDVTTQAQILALIKDIQRRMGIGVIFITHDFGVVADIADRIVVMRHGAVVEAGAAAEILNRPQHPYTRQLIAAVPHKPEGKDEAAATPPLMTVAVVQDLRHRRPPGRGIAGYFAGDPPGRNPGTGRRIGLGQVHAGQRADRPGGAR